MLLWGSFLSINPVCLTTHTASFCWFHLWIVPVQTDFKSSWTRFWLWGNCFHFRCILTVSPTRAPSKASWNWLLSCRCLFQSAPLLVQSETPIQCLISGLMLHWTLSWSHMTRGNKRSFITHFVPPALCTQAHRAMVMQRHSIMLVNYKIWTNLQENACFPLLSSCWPASHCGTFERQNFLTMCDRKN